MAPLRFWLYGSLDQWAPTNFLFAGEDFIGAPAAAAISPATGFQFADGNTASVPVGYYNYMDSHVMRVRDGTWTTTPQPISTLRDTIGDGWITEPYVHVFSAGTWTLSLSVRARTNAVANRFRFRWNVYKIVDGAAWSTAEKLNTSTIISPATTANISTTANTVISATWDAPAFSTNSNERLVFQLGVESTATGGTAVSRILDLWVGSNSFVLTAEHTNAVPQTVLAIPSYPPPNMAGELTAVAGGVTSRPGSIRPPNLNTFSAASGGPSAASVGGWRGPGHHGALTGSGGVSWGYLGGVAGASHTPGISGAGGAASVFAGGVRNPGVFSRLTATGSAPPAADAQSGTVTSLRSPLTAGRVDAQPGGSSGVVYGGPPQYRVGAVSAIAAEAAVLLARLGGTPSPLVAGYVRPVAGPSGARATGHATPATVGFIRALESLRRSINLELDITIRHVLHVALDMDLPGDATLDLTPAGWGVMVADNVLTCTMGVSNPESIEASVRVQPGGIG